MLSKQRVSSDSKAEMISIASSVMGVSSNLMVFNRLHFDRVFNPVPLNLQLDIETSSIASRFLNYI